MKNWILLFILIASFNSFGQDEIILLKQNSEPKYLENFPIELGLCDQVYAELSNRLSTKELTVKIDPIFYPVKRLMAKLELGQGHIFCGAGRTKNREDQFVYSVSPVYHVNNVVIAHKEETYTAKNYAELVQPHLVVGAYFGTSSAAFLKTHKNIRVNDNITTLEEAMRKVASKSIQYFYYHDLGLKYLVDKSELPIKLLPTKFRTIPQWLIFSKKLNTQDLKLISDTFESMVKDGFIESLSEKYLLPNH